MYEGYKPILIDNQLNVTVQRDEVYDCWQAHCKTLNFFERGETEKEAKENLDNLINNYFSAHYEYNKNLQQLSDMENIVIERIGDRLVLRELQTCQ